MTKRIILSIALIFSAVACYSQSGKLAAMKGVVKNGYNFWLYAPAEYFENSEQRMPLIIFLHGASLCGSNMNRSLRYGVTHAIKKGRKVPAMVMTPQNPGGSWNPEKVNNILTWVEEHYRVDSTRIYIIGMSLGGYGTLDFVGTYPEKIAASMALCGGTTIRDLQQFGKLPLWILHGTADRAVRDQSRRIVEALEKSGNDKLLRYDWLKGANHGAPARIFYLKQTYDWLLSHSLSDNPRQVNRDISITLQDMKNAYSDLNASETHYEVVNSF